MKKFIFIFVMVLALVSFMIVSKHFNLYQSSEKPQIIETLTESTDNKSDDEIIYDLNDYYKQFLSEIPKESIHKYKEPETISLDEYLYTDKTNGELILNENNDVIFNNKVIIITDGIPLNKDTAYTDLELKIYFVASGAEPREGCDPTDTLKNGTLGCYIYSDEE